MGVAMMTVKTIRLVLGAMVREREHYGDPFDDLSSVELSGPGNKMASSNANPSLFRR